MNNVFNTSRFLRLYKQQVVLNSKLLLYGMIGYCGVIFLVLSIIQIDNIGNNLNNVFHPMMIFFVLAFGVLYTGYSFPSLRTKESTFSYLTLPASTFEKFIFEFSNRVILAIVFLPLLYWAMFNITGYFYRLARGIEFTHIGIEEMFSLPFEGINDVSLYKFAISGFLLLIFLIPFTGATIFVKQPLIKTFFSVTILILCYIGLIYLLVEPLGVGKYNLETDGWIVSSQQDTINISLTILMWIANLVLLSVAYLKLKEKEV